TFLPSLEQVHLQGWWQLASSSDREEVYLKGLEEATIRIQSGTGGAVEHIAPFPADVFVRGPWIYLVEFVSGEPVPKYRLHRRLKNAPEDALEVILEDSQTPPHPLADGRWLIFRVSVPREPGDLLLFDPESGE